jgi:CheY-like chemotaxis protein
MMPIVDGWTFCKIRQGIATLMEIPVITISAASTTGTSEPLRADGYIKKPFAADALIEMVTRMAGRKTFRARTRPRDLHRRRPWFHWRRRTTHDNSLF